MSYDFSKLNGRIVERFGTQYNFAIAMGVSERTLSLKLNSKVDWKSSEIMKIKELLEIDENEIPVYFFKEKVKIS